MVTGYAARVDIALLTTPLVMPPASLHAVILPPKPRDLTSLDNPEAIDVVKAKLASS